MNKLGEKSLKTLEYYEILEKLAGQAASQAAKEKCVECRRRMHYYSKYCIFLYAFIYHHFIGACSDR